jgi:hypothetical protein
MARAVVAGGLTPGQLAKAYGYTEGQISRIMNSPCFLTELARLEAGADEDAAKVQEDIKKMAVRAVEVIDDQLNKPGIDPKVQQKAAFDVLDRAGHGKGKKRPITVGGDLNVTQVNVDKMSDKDLREDVMDLIEGKDYD